MSPQDVIKFSPQEREELEQELHDSRTKRTDLNLLGVESTGKPTNDNAFIRKRREELLADPFVGRVKDQQVWCTACDKWIKLNTCLHTSAWLQHTSTKMHECAITRCR